MPKKIVNNPDFQAIGEETVAAKIAQAEGTTIEKAKKKLKDAKDKALKKVGHAL